MSKMKNLLMMQEYQEFELELEYQEYLQENFSEPREMEIMKMAKEVLLPSTFSEMFWYVYATNNSDYRPETRA